MLQAIGVAFATVFVAELGDKSMLMALSLAARYRRAVLLSALLTASALTMGLSVALGSALGQVLPTGALNVAAGVLFLVFAVVTLRGEDDEEEATAPAGGGRSFLTVVLTVSLAELGDKTMVAALALAATTSAVGVWVGATLGMTAAGAAAVLVGASLWRRLEPATVRRVSAALFGLIGIALLVEALR